MAICMIVMNEIFWVSLFLAENSLSKKNEDVHMFLEGSPWTLHLSRPPIFVWKEIELEQGWCS
jgi:hypothetical protein